jgi:hypothetical protein
MSKMQPWRQTTGGAIINRVSFFVIAIDAVGTSTLWTNLPTPKRMTLYGTPLNANSVKTVACTIIYACCGAKK